MLEPTAPKLSLEAQLRTIIETAVDGLVIIDKFGTVLLYNRACEKIFGYSADEVIGRNVRMLMPAPDREAHDTYLKNYLDTGHRKIIGIGREVRGLRKDGTTFPMDLSVGEAHESGQSFFVGIIRDITQRKAAENAVHQTALQLRAVVDTAVDGVILIDEIGRVQVFNPACERMFGYSAGEVVGENVRMLMPAPYQEAHDSYLRNYLDTGERKIIGIGRQVVGRRKDGSTFPMDLSVGEAAHEGRRSFVGIIRDISDRLATEAQLRQAQKMEAVGQLTGGIAHDFNNLLAVVIGNLEFLGERIRQDAQSTKLLETATRAADRGADLTRRLLTFARRQPLRPAPANLNDIVSGITDMLGRTLGEMISVRVHLAESLWSVIVDHSQVENALLNLAVNSRDAMPNGGQLLITTRNMSVDAEVKTSFWEIPAGQYVEVAVSDTGIGMAPETLSRVFEPFFTTKETGKGTGLGLSMVYGFVTQSGGRIKIYSEVGQGTTVKMYFPQQTVSTPAAEGDAETPAPEKPRDVASVLVVEDDPAVRELAVMMLSSLGYRTIAAGDGATALAELDRHPEITFLLTDIVLPGGLRGGEIAKRALAARPNLAVVFMSGYAPELLSGQHAPEAGSLLIDKPFRRADLARALQQADQQRGAVPR
jgi:PAS domain S-box-containing protein